MDVTTNRPRNAAQAPPAAGAEAPVSTQKAGSTALSAPPPKSEKPKAFVVDQFTESKTTAAAPQQEALPRPAADRSALRARRGERKPARGVDGPESAQSRSAAAANAELASFSAPQALTTAVEASAKTGLTGGGATLETSKLPRPMQDALKQGAKDAGLDPKLVDSGQLKLQFDPKTGNATIEASAGGKSKSVEIGGDKAVKLLNDGLKKLPKGEEIAKHLEFTFEKADGKAPARIGVKAKDIDLEITKGEVGLSYSVPDAMQFVESLGGALKSAKFDTAKDAFQSLQNVLNTQAKLNPRVEAELKDLGKVTLDVAPSGQVQPLDRPMTLDKKQIEKLAGTGDEAVKQMLTAARPALEPQLKAMGISWPPGGNLKDIASKLPGDFKMEVAYKLNMNGSTNSDWRIGPVNGKTISGSSEVNTGGIVSLLWKEYVPYLTLSTPPKDDPKTANLKENEYVFAKLEKGDASLTVGYNLRDAQALIRAGQELAKAGKTPTMDQALDLARKYNEIGTPDYAKGDVKYKDVSAQLEVVREPMSGQPPSAAKSGSTLMPDLVRERLKDIGVDADKLGDKVRFDLSLPSVKDGKVEVKGDVYVQQAGGKWEKLSLSASADPGKGASKFALQVAEKVMDAFKSGKVEAGKVLDTVQRLGSEATEFFKNLSAKDAVDLLKGAGDRFGEIAKKAWDNMSWEKAADFFQQAPKELARKMWSEISWDDAAGLIKHSSKEAVGQLWGKLSWGDAADLLKNVPKEAFEKVWDAVGADQIGQALEQSAERKAEVVKAMWGKMSGWQKAALVTSGILNPVMLLGWGLSL